MAHTIPWIRPEDAQQELAESLAALRDGIGVPADFPPEVLAEAATVIREYRLPDLDATAIPFVTIDPPGSLDLDQALHIERAGTGYLVRYAIADLPAFVPLGGALDEATRRRGQTFYAPDGRIPLHPAAISEDAASLLPGATRGAYLFTHRLDAEGAVTRTDLSRATVRSRARLDYETVQRSLDDGTADDVLALLREVGALRVEQERLRGGASLNLPEQQIVRSDGGYALQNRPVRPIEDANAQISLLTGMSAARIMLDGGLGVLRTMPAPDPGSIERYREQARALGHPWPAQTSYGEFLRSLRPDRAADLALLHAATSLFRGAGYTAFDGTPPADPEQSAVAAPYAHTTAPLRRLVDRFVLPTCLALVEGRTVPDEIRRALPELPELMRDSDRRAGELDRSALDAVEAAVLAAHVGQEFDAVVLVGTEDGTGNGSANGNAGGNGTGNGKPPSGTIQVLDPVVSARCSGVMTTGSTVRTRLTSADIRRRTVAFELA
ncbi:exoribonuclease R [Tersicoccus solisilvae]|uniref:Exoribonuclease R n=1 Tax=Tersicoccus solisilvae TaxID=1882339 RepID=A0ABQ1P010_9MICC|nr:RNB domain-containing ribonuclease [Tersicoccus solisilvae]GGC88031.1 exoribonuclease R [Tersicoccus solisilvae]